MSISIKLMGVPGPKLMDDEKLTQDMFGVSTPTFVTPDTKCERAAADRELQERADLLFPQPARSARPRPHHAGAVDQDAEQPVRGALLQLRALSARRGAGDAVLGLAEVDRSARRSRACRCARPTTTCARRWSTSLGRGRRRARLPGPAADRPAPACRSRTPACCWPEKLSPRVTVATLRLPRQKFDSPAQMDFAQAACRTTRGTPSPSTARSATRAARGSGCTGSCRSCGTRMNAVPHYEPTGDEVFE